MSKIFIDGEIVKLKTFILHNEKILLHQNYLLDFSTKKKTDMLKVCFEILGIQHQKSLQL